MGEGHLRRFLNLCYITIFRSLLIRGSYDFPYRFCSSGNFPHGLCQSWDLQVPLHIPSSRWHLLDFFSVAPSSKVTSLLISIWQVTRYVDSEGLGYLTISHKYSLLSGGFQLVSFLFRYMDKHWTAKYFEMAYLWLLSGEHFFRGLEPKCAMG
jgi:hypothetical protein